MSDTSLSNMSRQPETPLPSPARWVRDNLFSSISNTLQTIFFSLIIFGLLRWVLGQVFSEESDWESVATNIRLLMTYNYPADQFVRIWVAAGTVFFAIGSSFAAWNINPAITIRRLVVGFVGFGVFLLLCAVIAPSVAPSSIRNGMYIVGAVLAVGGLVVRRLVPGAHLRFVPFSRLLTGAAAIIVALIWILPFGRHSFSDGELTIERGVSVASSTKVPWTVLFVVLLVAFFGGRVLAARFAPVMRRALIAWWVIGPAFVLFLVLRDPAFDWGRVWSVDVPIAAAFALGGGVLLYILARPGRDDLARVVGAVLVAFAIFNWIAAFAGWYPMLQKVRISFLLVGLVTLLVPTFAGERSARIRLASSWIGLIVIVHWLLTAINTESTLVISAPPFLGGLVLTVTIAYYVMLASFPLGVLLSLARTSKMPIFRVLSTSFIEVVRGVPLITVLFFFSIMLPLFLPRGMGISDLAAVFIGYTLFSAAYMAENLRGGLQSVRRGQYEASDALGLSTVQRTVFIVLPQALRVAIPNLVGQAIATFKETSLIAIVGGFDILRIANSTIPNQPDFLGQKRPALLFIALVYFVFTYSMSKSAQNLEKKLQAGQAR
ncbi:MAG: ABC transporter permease subunit [Ilumatobacteraceae bacterium]